MREDTIVLGDVEITRIVEWEGPMQAPSVLLPDGPAHLWTDNREWLQPHFWDPASEVYRAAMTVWVVRSEGRTILVDTGMGNHKYRPYLPLMSYLDTSFLARLAEAGVTPDDVDLVINTHLHADHVGWNTVLRDREWVPTFPHATYLMPRADAEFWNPVHEYPKQALVGGLTAGFGNQNMFEDSVAPVIAAGQAVLWEDEYVIDGNLRLDPRPGHTPGLSVLTVESGSDRAVFVGDLLHTPVQLLDPGQRSCYDEDAAMARDSRRQVLSWAADHTALVLPAHFAGAGAAEITRRGEGFAVSGWASFPVDGR